MFFNPVNAKKFKQRWILTAAHCVSGDPNHPAENMLVHFFRWKSVKYHTRFVRLGDHDLTDEGDATKADTFQVDYYIMHSKWVTLISHNAMTF